MRSCGYCKNLDTENGVCTKGYPIKKFEKLEEIGGFMADKEERITIHQVLYPCKKCSINCNKNDWKNCDFYQNYISGMTRQEAIERMAKAIYNFEIVACSHDECGNKQCENCETWKWCENIAEAALNALLEEQK